MSYCTADTVIRRAGRLTAQFHTRNADDLASALGITVVPVPFRRQNGVYKIIERNPFIFLREDLEPGFREIVLLHEIGHHILHRREASLFREFNIFDMRSDRMEYEANLFAAEIALTDEEVLSCIELGYDVSQIARALYSDINLVALKVAELNRRGYQFRLPEHDNAFLGKTRRSIPE